MGVAKVAKVMKAPRKKIERRRLTGKTPALTAGCYAGESASDVARTSYWCQYVSHDPVYFLGAESVFEEYDAKEQARREANRDREMREFRFAQLDARKPIKNLSCCAGSRNNCIAPLHTPAQ